MREEIKIPSWVLPGSLSKIEREGKKGKRVYWYLTWTRKGRSGSLYIPPGLVEKVREGIRNWQEVKEILEEEGWRNVEKLKEMQ